MTHAEFQERWELEAGKEAESFLSLSAEELARRVRDGEFGTYYTLWRAVSAKCEVSQVRDAMLGILRSDADYLIRYHCADALLALSGGHAAGFQAVELSARETHDVRRRLEEFESWLSLRR